ncbi:hypothetical protein HanXRQr2_Chr16g0731031 [Helianthus annuus]|uniref:Uncharacterized protein n=1 Tax=Helianthus annuus TaxID=4232 RepID=A0A9K3DNK5_HELAN|nr:hypothetical protein HanXRQr2_Chr16g0731031 [Helianthus annuus]
MAWQLQVRLRAGLGVINVVLKDNLLRHGRFRRDDICRHFYRVALPVSTCFGQLKLGVWKQRLYMCICSCTCLTHIMN